MAEQRLDFARAIAADAAALLVTRLEERLAARDAEEGAPDASGPEFKGRRELVTAVDRESELLLVDAIRARFPDDAILAEEGVASPRGVVDREAEFTWVLDPIDGTTNFVHAHPSFSVSVGVLRDGKAWRGVVHAPMIGGCEGGQSFYGGVGLGAWCNGRALRVSASARLRDSVVATGFSYNRNEAGVDTNAERFVAALMEVRGMRRCGSAALDLAHVAAGVYDAYWEKHLAPYDVAAGIALVLGAGGSVSTFNPGADAILDGEILASNGRVEDELRALFSALAGGA